MFQANGVELYAGVGAGPGGVGDLLPQLAGLERAFRPGRPALGTRLFLLGAPVEVPGLIAQHGLHEGVGDDFLRPEVRRHGTRCAASGEGVGQAARHTLIDRQPLHRHPL